MYTTTYDRSQPNPTPARPGGTGVASFVRRRPLTVFMAWFFTVGQALVFTPIVARGLRESIRPRRPGGPCARGSKAPAPHWRR